MWCCALEGEIVNAYKPAHNFGGTSAQSSALDSGIWTPQDLADRGNDSSITLRAGSRTPTQCRSQARQPGRKNYTGELAATFDREHVHLSNAAFTVRLLDRAEGEHEGFSQRVKLSMRAPALDFYALKFDISRSREE